MANKRKATDELNNVSKKTITERRHLPPRNRSQLNNKGTPIPKLCYKDDCLHDIIFGQHFNRTDLNKGYNGKCPECGETPKAEAKN